MREDLSSHLDMCFIHNKLQKININLFSNFHSFDSDFDAPEEGSHGDDKDFNEEEYLKWRKQDEENNN